MKVETEQSISSEASSRASLNRWLPFQLTLTFGAFLFIGLNSGASGVLVAEFQDFYKLDKASVGYFFWAAALGYLLAAFSSGFVVEKLGLRRFLLSGIIIFGLSSLVMCFAPPLAIALLARMFLGWGAALLETGSNFFVAGLPRNTTLFNYLHAFFGAGALVGPIFTSFILAIPWQWNTLFFFWVGISFLLVVGIGIVFQGNSTLRPQSQSKSSAEQPKKESASMLSTLKVPLVWLMAAFLLAYVGVEMTLGLWSYSFLTEVQHYTPILAGALVSGYWLGLTLGRLVLAKLAERFKLGDQFFLLACIGGTLAGFALLWLTTNAVVITFSLWFIGFSLGPIYPTTLAVISKLLPARFLSNSIAFVTSLSILGVAIFPAIAGSLAEAFGLTSMLPYLFVLSLLMLVLWLPMLKPAKR
jgi:fucose permease